MTGEKQIIQDKINEAINTRLDYSYQLRIAKTVEEKRQAQDEMDRYTSIIEGMFQIARALSWCIVTNSITGNIVLV